MRGLSVLLMSLLSMSIFAQKQWTLQQCVDYAIEHNLTVQQAQNTTEIAKWNKNASAANLFPTLNGFASHTYNFGQTIDPFTNQFANSQVRSNSFALSSQVTLFGGLSNYNLMRQRRLEYMAATYGVAKIKNDITLNVITAFLDVIFSEELDKLNAEQVALTQSQVDRMRVLVETGSEAKGSLLDLEAQLGRDQVAKINGEAQLSIAKLTLVQLLQLDNANQFEVVRPPEAIFKKAPSELTPSSTVYEKALETMPEIKQSETNMLASERALGVARGSLLPRLTLSASYGSGYSGLASEVTGVNLTGVDTIGFSTGGYDVLTPSYEVLTQTIAFGDQLKNNLNQSVGFNLTIPLFNGLQSQSSYKIAQINLANARLDYEQAKNTLQQNIQKAHTDALAAKRTLEAAESAVVSADEAFDYAKVRYESGLITAIDFANAKNVLAQTKSELLRSKYDLVFKVKILDFYQGKKIELK